jgi:hypothetical protein
MREKRKVERFDLHIDAMLNFQYESRVAKEIKLRSRDISCDGVFLETTNPLPIGTKVDLNLLVSHQEINSHLKNEKTNISTSGKVVRANEEGMVIEFDKTHKVSQLKLST